MTSGKAGGLIVEPLKAVGAACFMLTRTPGRGQWFFRDAEKRRQTRPGRVCTLMTSNSRRRPKAVFFRVPFE